MNFLLDKKKKKKKNTENCLSCQWSLFILNFTLGITDTYILCKLA